jgi:ribonucleoside-diphosphate reductase alpha chain
MSAQVVPILKGTRADLSSEQARIAKEAGHWPRVFTKDGVHPFDEVEWRRADAEIRNAKGDVVFFQKDIEVPAWWTQNNINVVADKYFRVINGVRETSVKQVFQRVCSTLRRWAEEQKYFNTDRDAQVFEEELCYALLHQYGAFNSPVWFNLGIAGRAQMASACFIQDVNDSIEDIMKYQTAEMKIFRSGSGSGANISKLRSSYEKISSGSYTSGPISWMEGLDAYAKAMKSGGATRNAAKMVVMDMDHPDVLQTRDGRPGFIRCKAEEEKLAHALVAAGYSAAYDDPNGAYKRIRFQAANNSVSVPDSFMQAMLDDGQWETKERRSGKTVHKYKARELWNEIAQAAWVCGDPGVQFTDAINRWHTTPKSGPIRASNPCFHPDTRIATEHGLVRIEDLCSEFESFDSNKPTFRTLVQTPDGPQLKDAVVFPTGVHHLVEVHTRRGRVIKVTHDHRLMTKDGWVEARDLTDESILMLQAGQGAFSEKGAEPCLPTEAQKAFSAVDDRLMWHKLAGWVVGDGWVLRPLPCRNTHEVGLLFGRDDKDVLDTVSKFFERNDIPYSLKRQDGSVGESPDYVRIHRKAVWQLMSTLSCEPGTKAPVKKVMDAVFCSTRLEQLSFLSGLFSADGTFNIQPKKNVDARFSSTSLELLRGVQALLLNLGVNSTLYKDRRPGDKPSFTYTTKSGEVRTYPSKEKTNDLVITGQSLRTFKSLMLEVGLLSSRKQARLDEIPEGVNNNGRDQWTDEVVRVVDKGEQTLVYDITEPETSSLIADGVVAHNCSEFLHVDNTACNLCAINLTKFFDGRKFVKARFEQAVRLFSTSQMAIIDKADYPTEEIAHNSHKLRPIGTNYGDLGALLMKLGYGYDTDEGRAVAAQMASLMTGMVYVTAAKLAARVGSFPDFELNREDMLRVMKMHQEADATIIKRWHLESSPTGDDVVPTSAEVWREAIALGERYGYSVSQASLQAPLGTISFLMGMSTTGIEPAFSLVSYKSMVGGGSLRLVNTGVRDALLGLGYAEDQINTICKSLEDNGTIEGAPGLKPEHLPVFDCAMPSAPGGRYLSPMAHIKMMAAIQPLITCAMSKTVNLPSEITAEEIAKIYEESWRLGLKCIALYRDGCKASQPLSTKKDGDKEGIRPAPAPKAPPVDQLIAEAKAAGARREKLPAEVNSWRHKFEIDGYKGYIIVGEYADGRPGEVFLKLGKPGSTISGLIDGFTQLMSIALQYGVPLPKLIQSFVDTRFEPAGITSNKHIRFAKSLYDYLFKVLDVRYYGGSHSGLEEKLAQMKASEAPPPAMDVREGISKEPDSSTRIQAVATAEEPVPPRKNLGGPPCARCGSITQRNGSCYLCTSCGQTTGCS